jgi:hypothetical protein
VDIEQLLTDLGDIAMSGTTSDHDKEVIDEAMKSLRLVPKLIAVVEAARETRCCQENALDGHECRGLNELSVALAALDAGEGGTK